MLKRFAALPLAALFLPAMLRAQGSAPAPATPEVVPVPATTLPLKHTPERTRADITANDLMTRLYIFADDSMTGREAGTEGNTKGTDYIAGEVKRMGLVPMGENGTYFQTLPFKVRRLDPASSVTVAGAPLTLGSEWAGRPAAAFAHDSLQSIYGGTLGDSAGMVAPEQTVGKLVIYQLTQGRGIRRASSRLAPEAAAIALIVPDQFIGFVSAPSTYIEDPAAPPPPASPPSIVMTRAAAAKLFDRPVDSLTAGVAGRPVSIDLRLQVEPVAFPARNVVAVLPGRDPQLQGQYVAVGAHNDHIGIARQTVEHDSMRIFLHLVRPGGAEDGGKQATPEQQAEVNAQLAAWRAQHPGTRADSISNGADDDGSGSVSVLEIAEKVSSLKQRPRRSILFVWHVGEEKGLLGSEWFTDHPTVPRDSIVAQLNIDMVGRGDAWDVTGASKDGQVLRGNPAYLQVVGSRRLSKELGDLLEEVNTTGKHGLQFDYAMDANGHPMNIYCRSDHYEYARYGIPIAFFTTGGHSDYHQVTDEPQYIDYPHMARVDNFIEDALLHLANLDHRVVVDQPRPDPKGRCQQ
jgi:peptidase M28-like protein